MVMPMFLGQRYEQEQFDSANFGIESERVTLTTDDSLSIAAWRTGAAVSYTHLWMQNIQTDYFISLLPE